MTGKIKGLTALLRALSPIKKRGKRIVFTNGCFDILHVGHVTYLAKARAMGDLLVVGVNSDSSVRRLKGKDRPINPESDRASVLAGLESVDLVTIFDDDTPEKLITAVCPDILAKGGDWKTSDIVGGPYVISQGGKVVSIPFVDGYSTTGVIRKMKR